ncbi:MAG: acyl carrier protein [Anaerorhabdus sp.]|uniref:acyl carrier protein n=1 Tax=Anaerorhabdus sp. TaxID=1872524 RepID=UPI003A890460
METFDKLKTLLSQTMSITGEIHQDTTFENLGLDSFEIVDFALTLEEYFGITFFDEELHDLNTVEELVRCIDHHTI